MIRLQGCWEDLVGNQSAAVNMSVAAGNVAERLRRTIEIELDQVDIKFAQLKRGNGERPSSLGTTTLYDTVLALNAETKELKQGVESLTAGREEGVKRAVATAGGDLSQRVKSLEDEIVELREQLESAPVVVGGVSFNSKPQAQAWLNQSGGLASDFVLLALDPCSFLAWAHVS